MDWAFLSGFTFICQIFDWEQIFLPLALAPVLSILLTFDDVGYLHKDVRSFVITVVMLV